MGHLRLVAKHAKVLLVGTMGQLVMLASRQALAKARAQLRPVLVLVSQARQGPVPAFAHYLLFVMSDSRVPRLFPIIWSKTLFTVDAMRFRDVLPRHSHSSSSAMKS